MVGIFETIRKFFRGGDSHLNQMETLIIEQVIDKLPSDLSRKMTNRVASINLVCRLDDDREVNCYEMESGNVQARDQHRICQDNGEHILACFEIQIDLEVRLTGKIWVVHGDFFSIEFDQSPSKIDTERIKRISVDLTESFKD